MWSIHLFLSNKDKPSYNNCVFFHILLSSQLKAQKMLLMRKMLLLQVHWKRKTLIFVSHTKTGFQINKIEYIIIIIARISFIYVPEFAVINDQ